MFKKLSLMVLAASITIVFFNSCEKGTEPEEKPSIRDYEWTIDTIDPGPNYRTYAFNIWGASPDDVWLIGSADTRLHTTWHYNGKIWYVVQLPGFVEGAGIWGFSNDNIWMGTSNSSIWHYDGKTWREFDRFKYKDYDIITLSSIHGLLEDEVYAVGFAANYDGSAMTRIFMRFNGTNWEFIDILEFPEIFTQVKVDITSENVFIVSQRYNSLDNSRRLYIYNENTLKEISVDAQNYLTLGTIGKKVYITIDSKIYSYENGDLILFKNFSGTDFLSRIWGRSESDFFTVNKNSKVGHFDGIDLINIFEVDGASLNRAVLFEKEIFIHAKERQINKDLVIHGKLKE